MARWTDRLSRAFAKVSDFLHLDEESTQQGKSQIVHNYAVFERLALRDNAASAQEWGTGFVSAMGAPAKILCAEFALIEVLAQKTRGISRGIQGGFQPRWTIAVRSNGAVDLLDDVDVSDILSGGPDNRVCRFEEGLLAQGFEKVERRRLNQLFDVWFEKSDVAEADLLTGLDRVGQLLCAEGQGVNIDNTSRGRDLLESRRDRTPSKAADTDNKPGPIVF